MTQFNFVVSGMNLDDIWDQAERHVRRLCDYENVIEAAWTREWEQWSVDIDIDLIHTQGGAIVAYEAEVTARRSR